MNSTSCASNFRSSAWLATGLTLLCALATDRRSVVSVSDSGAGGSESNATTGASLSSLITGHEPPAEVNGLVLRVNGHNWFGKTKSPTTRFHHRIYAPTGPFAGALIRSALTDAYARHYTQTWIIARSLASPKLSWIRITECPSVAAAHNKLAGNLNNVARADIDLSSVPGGPGDVTAYWHMARDNVEVDGRAVSRETAPVYSAFASLDQYLISNWPLETAKSRPGPQESLKVGLSMPKSIRKDFFAELHVSVTRNGQELPLKDLSFRVLMEPRRLRWDDGKLFYSSDHPGPAKITLDAFAEPRAYGQGVTSTSVEE